jgi:predicted nucleotidyltransferase
MTKLEYAHVVKERLLAKLKPERIILFGSVARGDYHEDSDLDLLIVWDEMKDMPNIKRRIYLRRVIGEMDIPVDLLTCTTEELSKATRDENSFTSQILREGEVIYARLD